MGIVADSLSDPLDTLVTAVASVDETIRARVLSFANLALDQAEYQLRHGTPAMKERLIRVVMSAALRQANTTAQGEDAEKTALREKQEELFGAVLGGAVPRLASTRAIPSDPPT